MHPAPSRPSRRSRAAVHLTVAAAVAGSLFGFAAPARAGAAAPPVRAVHQVAAPARYAIPDAAMLQAADLYGATPTAVTDDYWSALRPPQPCATRGYPSAALRRTDRAITALIGIDERPTVIMEDVATYRATGAHRYLRDLRRAVAACTGPDEQGRTWSVLATGVAGDESVLLRLREYIDYAETFKDSYVLVARVGRALVVLADVGWETAGGHLTLVRELGTTAAQRATVLARR
jgi:hypothetical protein